MLLEIEWTKYTQTKASLCTISMTHFLVYDETNFEIFSFFVFRFQNQNWKREIVFLFFILIWKTEIKMFWNKYLPKQVTISLSTITTKEALSIKETNSLNDQTSNFCK